VIIPSGAIILEAKASLKTVGYDTRASQIKELLLQIDGDESFQAGYELGLQVARLVVKSIKSTDEEL